MTPMNAAREELIGVREALGSRCGLRSEEVSDAALERAVRYAAASAECGFEELLARIRAPEADGGLALQHLLRKVTVGETTFFRHAEDLDWLRTKVLPEIVSRRAAEGRRRLRIWSAGCATGEEAYTLAILALEAVPDRGWDVQVMGSDINDEALEGARTASYGEWSFRGVAPEVRARWFDRSGTDSDPRWTPLPVVREAVDFQYLNLRDPIYPAIFTRTTELDLIVCRNVFLYFFPEMVRTTVERFAACLVEDGALLCGPSDLFHARASELSGLLPDERESHRVRVSRTPRPTAEASGVTPRVRHTPPRTTRARAAGASAAPRSRPARTPSASPTPPQAGSAPAMRIGLVALLEAGAWREAAAEARAALESDPLSLESARCLALALTSLSDPAATDAWRRVLYLDPADAGGHFALGMALRHSGRRPEARAHFRTVVRLLERSDPASVLPGPDALPISWVRSACRSLAGEVEGRGPR